jgi:DNA-directed RNA polymerase subunit K/omega
MDLSHKDSPKPVMFFVGQALEEIASKKVMADNIAREKHRENNKPSKELADD